MDRRKRSDEAAAPPSHAEVLYEGQWYTAEFVKDVAAGVRVRLGVGLGCGDGAADGRGDDPPPTTTHHAVPILRGRHVDGGAEG